ncbi:MAG: response regulator [Sandaracinaceae bacterium]|nr:response regulator [Sandaracinaceae bacterium]
MTEGGLAHAPFFVEERLEEALELAYARASEPVDLCLEVDGDVPELVRGDGEQLREAVAEAIARIARTATVVVHARRAPSVRARLVVEVGSLEPLGFELEPVDAEARGRPAELAGRHVRVIGSSCRHAIAERLRRLGVEADTQEPSASALASPLPDAVVVDVCAEHAAELDTEHRVREHFGLGALPLVIVSDRDLHLDPTHLRTMSISRPVRHSRLVSALRTVLAPARDDLVSGTTNEQVRTLVVDDQPLNRAVIAGLLRRLGQRHVDTACHGLDALEACRTSRYDLVLMDLQMPVLDGLEATEAILATVEPRPRVVALTASTFERDRHACQRVGMRGFLEKPVTELHLAEQLERTREAMRRPARRSR